MSGYLQTQFGGACERGDWDAAARYFNELQAAPRDDLSHCEACYRSTAAMYYADRGETDRALELFEEIFSGQFVCGDEPEYSESQAAHLYLKTENFDEAKRLHLKSLAALAQHPEPSGIVLRHALFCLVTGNTERALDLVEKNAKLFDASELNVARQFDALTLLGVLTDALQKAGRGAIPVRGTGTHNYDVVLRGIAPAAGGGDFTADELAVFVWDRAAEIVAQFDARNGNDHYAQRLAARKELLDTRYDLPIGIDVFEPVESYTTEVVEPELNSGLEYVAAVANTLPNVSAALDLVRQGRNRHIDGDFEEGITDAFLHLLDVDLSESGVARETLADAFERSGLVTAAKAVLTIGEKLAGPVDEEDLKAFENLIERAQEVDDPASTAFLALHLAQRMSFSAPERANELLSLALENRPTQPVMQRAAIITADLALGANQIEDGRQALEQAAALSYGAIGEDIDVASIQARVGLWTEQYDQAVERYNHAIDIALGAQDYARAWPLLMNLSRAYAGNGSADDAVRALKRAQRYAQRTTATAPQLQAINYALGTQLVNAGHPHDALAPLTAVVDWNMENGGDPENVAAALIALGEASLRAEEYQQAFSAWYYGLDYSEENDLKEAEYGFALRLADFLLDSEHPEAPDFAERAYNLAQEQDDPVQVVNAAKRVATAQVVISETDDFSKLDKALDQLIATGEKGSPEVEVTRIEATLHKARLLWRLEKGIEAGEAALEAVQIAADIDLGEAQFDALVLAGVAFKSAGATDRARQALEEAQRFSEPGESPYEFAAQQLADL
jgi:hypothetical protein